MPFLDHDGGRAYYRHWAADDPRAAVIFLHGFGEHTGLYHRYGFALNAAGIDLWAVDQFGHGLTPGERGDFGTIEDSSALADALTELAEQETSRYTACRAGTFVRVDRDAVPAARAAPSRYRAGVISGAPLVPVAGAARQRHLVRPRPRLAVQRPVLPRLARERPAGLRRRRRHGPDPRTRPRVGPLRCRTARADGADAGRARRATIRSPRSARCAPTPSRSSRCPGASVRRRAPRHPQRRRCTARWPRRSSTSSTSQDPQRRDLEPGVVGGRGEERLEVVAPLRRGVLVRLDAGVLAAVEQQRPRLDLAAPPTASAPHRTRRSDRHRRAPSAPCSRCAPASRRCTGEPSLRRVPVDAGELVGLPGAEPRRDVAAASRAAR